MPHLDELEERAIPFVLELYPGGGFARFNPEVDHKLRLVLSSPCLRKVITTQPATTRYLLEKNFCSPDQIQEIFGVVTPEETLAPYGLAKKRYGFEKDRLMLFLLRSATCRMARTKDTMCLLIWPNGSAMIMRMSISCSRRL